MKKNLTIGLLILAPLMLATSNCGSVGPIIDQACEVAEQTLERAGRLLLAAEVGARQAVVAEEIARQALDDAFEAARDAGILDEPYYLDLKAALKNTHQRFVAASTRATELLATAQIWHSRAESLHAVACGGRAASSISHTAEQVSIGLDQLEAELSP